MTSALVSKTRMEVVIVFLGRLSVKKSKKAVFCKRMKGVSRTRKGVFFLENGITINCESSCCQ